jgi:diguanylate cyclase (GGDEF)-like protein
MIAVCGLIVLAAGIQIGVWTHQAEAIAARQESVGDPLSILQQALHEQYAQKFHDIYVLLALVVLVVDLSIIVALVLLSVSIHRLRERQQASESRAMHDPLTQLPNRRYLGEWLETSLAAAGRSDRNLVLLYLDLDGFKSVNDRFGHDIGDRVLQITAGRLRRALRRSDFVARLGGDEFVAVLPDTQSAPGLAVLVERLEAEIGKAPIAEIANDVVSASIGAAWFPTDGATADTLLAAADRAMYDVKRRHRAWRSPGITPPQSGHGLPQSAMT